MWARQNLLNAFDHKSHKRRTPPPASIQLVCAWVVLRLRSHARAMEMAGPGGGTGRFFQALNMSRDMFQVSDHLTEIRTLFKENRRKSGPGLCLVPAMQKKTSKEIQEIHQRALKAAEGYKRSEMDVLKSIQEVDESATFLRLGHTSLFNYMVHALGFSESVAANFITVSRKAKEIPMLQTAIQDGLLSVSKARKITPVLTLENQNEWVEKAKTLPQRQLEQEVAREIPREDVPERIKFITESRMELRFGISTEMEEKLRHVQDLESQRTGHSVCIEETLAALLEVYLEVKDPVRRANRILKKGSVKVSEHVARHVESKAPKDTQPGPIPVSTKHQVAQRDNGRCTHVDIEGHRCENRRWTDIHHVVPRSMGGSNALENLRTLCRGHHKMEHEAPALPSP